MKNPTEMMELVWLMNAAGNSVFEVRELLRSFLEQRQCLQEMAAAVAVDEGKSLFLKSEISRTLEEFAKLQEDLGETLLALQDAAAVMGGKADER